MHLKTLYVRFYKSFNYDYLRKSHPMAVPDIWDYVGNAVVGDSEGGRELFYPFVRIPLDQGITTVVGSNEAGKSQLLTAVGCLLTGEGIERRDFCRHSQFFAVNRAMAVPEFGGEFVGWTDDQGAAVAKLAKIDAANV